MALSVAYSGKVLAHVVGEHLVNDHGGHDHRHQHAEGEELAGRGLVHPVVDLAVQNLLPSEALDVRWQQRLQLPHRLGEGALPNFEKTEVDAARAGKPQRLTKFRSLQITVASAANPRSMGKPPASVTAWLPSSQCCTTVAKLPAEVRVGELVEQDPVR